MAGAQMINPKNVCSIPKKCDNARNVGVRDGDFQFEIMNLARTRLDGRKQQSNRSALPIQSAFRNGNGVSSAIPGERVHSPKLRPKGSLGQKTEADGQVHTPLAVSNV
jgi:hypothetical protein